MNHGLLIFNLLVAAPVFAWEPQTGDIIFQVSRASQSRAIQLATHSDYSHTGIVVMRNSEPYVFEAIGPVAYTPLQKWIAQGKDGRYIVRRVRGGLSSPQQQKLKCRFLSNTDFDFICSPNYLLKHSICTLLLSIRLYSHHVLPIIYDIY
ncbi:hypothetical protein ED033_15885, partial [Salmonella enterica]|nr:hypothetical protein [Salmonella enterica]